MGIHDYKNVIDEISAQAELDPQQLFNEGRLYSGDTLLRLSYLDLLNICRLEIDLGRPADCVNQDFQRWMLECNNEASSHMPVLAIHPDSGNTLLLLHFPLARPDTPTVILRFIGEKLDTVIAAWRTAEAQNDSPMESRQTPDQLAMLA